MTTHHVLGRFKLSHLCNIILLKSLTELFYGSSLYVTIEKPPLCLRTSHRMTPLVLWGKTHPSLSSLPSSAFVCFISIPHAGTEEHLIMWTSSFPLLKPQEFPAYVRASPVHFTNGSPRPCRNSVPNIISPDGGRGVSRRRWQPFFLTISMTAFTW